MVVDSVMGEGWSLWVTGLTNLPTSERQCVQIMPSVFTALCCKDTAQPQIKINSKTYHILCIILKLRVTSHAYEICEYFAKAFNNDKKNIARSFLHQTQVSVKQSLCVVSMCCCYLLYGWGLAKTQWCSLCTVNSAWWRNWVLIPWWGHFLRSALKCGINTHFCLFSLTF